MTIITAERRATIERLIEKYKDHDDYFAIQKVIIFTYKRRDEFDMDDWNWILSNIPINRVLIIRYVKYYYHIAHTAQSIYYEDKKMHLTDLRPGVRNRAAQIMNSIEKLKDLHLSHIPKKQQHASE